MGHDSHQSTASLGCVFVHIWRSHFNEDSPPFGQRGSCDRATVCHLWVHESLRAVIPLLHVLNLNCNGIWVLAWSIPRLPPPSTVKCRRFMWALCICEYALTTHSPAKTRGLCSQILGNVSAGMKLNLGSMCILTKRNNSSPHIPNAHTQGGFLGWLHPSLEFAGKIEPRSDK